MLGVGTSLFQVAVRRKASLTLPAITAFTVGPQSGTNIPVAITLIEGATPPTAIYIVGVVAGGAAPSATQIIAGQNGSGAAAPVAASIPVATSGLSNVNVTPPSSGTYDFYTVAEDAGAARSNVASALGVVYANYNPSTDLLGYQFSIDPSVIGTLYTDTAGTVPVTAPGDLVACVRDPYTNAIVATQATSGNRPIYQVDGGGKAYLQLWDGTTVRWLVTATLSFSTSGFNRGLISCAVQQDARPAANAFLAVHNNGGGGSFSILAPEINNTHRAGSRGTASSGASVVFAAGVPVKMVIGMYGTIPNDLVVLRRDGTQVAQSTADQGTGSYANAVFSIGASSAGATPFNGRLYHMTVAANATTDYTATDSAALEAFQNAKLI